MLPAAGAKMKENINHSTNIEHIKMHGCILLSWGLKLKLDIMTRWLQLWSKEQTMLMIFFCKGLSQCLRLYLDKIHIYTDVGITG